MWFAVIWCRSNKHKIWFRSSCNNNNKNYPSIYRGYSTIEGAWNAGIGAARHLPGYGMYYVSRLVWASSAIAAVNFCNPPDLSEIDWREDDDVS